MTKILVVEDTRATLALIRASLEDIAEVTCATSLAEAESFLKAGSFDLMVLDVMLPDGDGFSLCEKVRSSPAHARTPVIFLTGQSEIDDRVRGLKLGDDYVLKPFDGEELKARVQARLRRAGDGEAPLEAGGFRVDMNRQAVLLSSPDGGERDLDLTRIEFKILVLFIRHPGTPFSRAEVLKKVWGEGTHVSEHTVDTHISTLRKKIAPGGAQVTKIAKQGYILRFEA